MITDSDKDCNRRPMSIEQAARIVGTPDWPVDDPELARAFMVYVCPEASVRAVKAIE